MNQNHEVEFKTLVTKAQYQHILSLHPQAVKIEQKNTYFKSHSASFTNQKVAMRIRSIGDSFEFTIKVPMPLGDMEYNVPVQSSQLSELAHPDIQAIFQKLSIEGPFIMARELHTTRFLLKEELGELCMDHNQYCDQEDYELEYEVSGDPEAGMRRFMELLEEAGIPYIENKTSKFLRCLQAAKN